MNDLAACGMADLAQHGPGGDRPQPGTGVDVDRKTRVSGGREAAATRAAGRGPSDAACRQEADDERTADACDRVFRSKPNMLRGVRGRRRVPVRTLRSASAAARRNLPHA